MEKTTDNLPTLTVSQLTQAIKHNLEETFPSIWLQGEISNFKKHTSGHFYFSLKDSEAQISAVMFRGQTQSLKKLPKDGDQVIVFGGLNVFPSSGKYQINVQELRFAGVGELLLKLEELKQKLHKLGWFSKERKRPLPKFPRRIGVVTSPTGAAIQDILNIVKRRYAGFQLLLNPVKVQGEGAALEIAKAIKQFNDYQLVDVMIVGRGGGSIEDLWAFNEEIVARAVYESKIPIICAVGHETDHCIAEYVADVRAPTPSAAAELVMAEKTHQLEFLDKAGKRMTHHLQLMIRQRKMQFAAIGRQPAFRSPYFLLGQSMQKLDEQRQSLDQTMKQMLQQKMIRLEGRHKTLLSLNPIEKITNYRQRLRSFAKLFDKQITHLFTRKVEGLKHLTYSLQTIDPKNLLQKGYAILFSEIDGSVITSAKSLRQDQKLKALLSDGAAISTINQVIIHE